MEGVIVGTLNLPWVCKWPPIRAEIPEIGIVGIRHRNIQAAELIALESNPGSSIPKTNFPEITSKTERDESSSNRYVEILMKKSLALSSPKLALT